MTSTYGKTVMLAVGFHICMVHDMLFHRIVIQDTQIAREKKRNPQSNSWQFPLTRSIWAEGWGRILLLLISDCKARTKNNQGKSLLLAALLSFFLLPHFLFSLFSLTTLQIRNQQITLRPFSCRETKGQPYEDITGVQINNSACLTPWTPGGVEN